MLYLRIAGVVAIVVAAMFAVVPGAASASEASWRLEQPPPPLKSGAPSTSTPIGLGHVGDVEFIAPNRGLLITSGDGGTIEPGVWDYDGASWKELAVVCGASDGRIAWAEENEFWTVSNGRPGQAANPESGELAPLEDNTLCHFTDGRVVTSYASIAFRANSYQAMHAAGCLGPNDCWFAGEPLPSGAPAKGSFHLHWNGTSLVEEPFEGEAQPVQSMVPFDSRLYEGVKINKAARSPEIEKPPVLHAINPEGVSPTFQGIPGEREIIESPDVPLYAPHEFVETLGALHLSSASKRELWGATGPLHQELGSKEPAQVTVVRFSSASGEWTQLLGASTVPSGHELFPEQTVTSIAAEPDGGGAWIALEPISEVENGVSPEALATVVHISSEGVVSAPETLPTAAERKLGVGEKGSAQHIVCPGAQDCWLATSQGWLFHLSSGEEALPVDDEGFSSLITNRPIDEGLPQVPPDAPPEESTGPGELSPAVSFTEKSTPLEETRVTVPLLTALHSRLVHGSTLELSFHLAVKARVRLLAKRHNVTVASTSSQTLGSGNRKLLLRLNPRRWPTKIQLQTHALAPLPTVAARSPSVDTVSTSLAFPKATVPFTAGSQF
jgi:hypothetical protein